MSSALAGPPGKEGAAVGSPHTGQTAKAYALWAGI